MDINIEKQLLYPLEFIPIGKSKIWGGSYLANNLQKPFSITELIGESWEISDIDNDESIVKHGALKGKSLRDIIKAYGYENIVGKKLDGSNIFPLLIKYIEANDNLSIQVHPNDEYAMKHYNSYGKTEMWVVVDAKENAKLLIGLGNNVTKEQLKNAIDNKEDIKHLFNYIDIKTNDVIYVPAGRVHALLDGAVIAEIQQSSDITFRLYDWDRVDDNGVSRQLHISESFDVISEIDNEPLMLKEEYKTIDTYQIASIIKNNYFDVSKISIEKNGIYESFTENTFEIIMVLSGSIIIESNGYKSEINRGSTILMPASLGQYMIKNINLENALFLSIKR